MKTISVVKIIKDVFTKMCIYFTILILCLTVVAAYLSMTLPPETYFMFALASLGAGIAVQVFKITKIPAVSRHIAFFVLLYLDFFLVFIPLSNYTNTNNTTLYLSVIFIAVYAVIFGITIGIKSAVNASKNKRLQYDKQFKDVK